MDWVVDAVDAVDAAAAAATATGLVTVAMVTEHWVKAAVVGNGRYAREV
jgi:hypothetical protein